MSKKALLMTAALLVAGIILTGCDPFDGEYRDGTRNIVIDIDNGIFNEPDAVLDWERGPGVDSITVTYILDGNEASKIVSVDDMVSGAYTQITHQVTGRLERVDVSAVNAAGTAMTVSIDDKPEDEEFEGWETFANLQRFRIGYNADSSAAWSSSFLTIDIAPRGGRAVRFKTDSGVTARMETDWSVAPLVSGQIAIEPVLIENPEGLSFDYYTAIVNEDLKTKYKAGYITPGADYEYHPWKEVWTYRELTETGLRIGDIVYKMLPRDGGSPHSYTDPTGNDSKSFIVDLSGFPDIAGKYLMIAVISRYDVLSVPSAVEIIEIR